MGFEPYTKNIFGDCALFLFAVAWIGAVLSFWPLYPHMAKLRHPGFSIWKDADRRPKFIRLLCFAALGPLSVLIGFTLGGWPAR